MTIAASVGVEHGQCGACGRLHSAEWGVTVRHARDHDLAGLAAYWRLCDPCYRSMMAYLEERPEVTPIRGYT